MAHKDGYLELAEGVNKFEQKYFEDNPKFPLTNKKMVKRACNGHYATFTEIAMHGQVHHPTDLHIRVCSSVSCEPKHGFLLCIVS